VLWLIESNPTINVLDISRIILETLMGIIIVAVVIDEPGLLVIYVPILKVGEGREE